MLTLSAQNPKLTLRVLSVAQWRSAWCCRTSEEANASVQSMYCVFPTATVCQRRCCWQSLPPAALLIYRILLYARGRQAVTTAVASNWPTGNGERRTVDGSWRVTNSVNLWCPDAGSLIHDISLRYSAWTPACEAPHLVTLGWEDYLPCVAKIYHASTVPLLLT